MSLEIYVKLLYIVCKHGTHHQIVDVLENARKEYGQLADSLFATIALEVIEWLASGSKLTQLYQFSATLKQSGFSLEAGIGLDEIGFRSNNEDLRQLARTQDNLIKQTETRVGLPDWYVQDVSRNQGFYREVAQDSAYQCFEYECGSNGRTGTLEIVTLERVLQTGFHSFIEWENYLHNLESEGVIGSIEVGQFDQEGPKVYCFYETPSGMKSLSDCMILDNAEALFTPSSIISIASKIVDLLILACDSGFTITAVDPLNVFWNPIDYKAGIKLANIGASLGFARYHCGIGSCRTHISEPETDRTTGTYFLGLLLLQMLNRGCSLESINSTKSKYNKKITLYDLLQIPDTPPQFRSILGRLLHSDPSFRYSDLKSLRSDLGAVEEFIHGLPDRKFLDARDNGSIYTLQEFTLFRLRVITRNPQIKNDSPIYKVGRILESLSHDLGYLSNPLLSLWHTDSISPWTLPFTNKARSIGAMSPEGKRLLSVARGWGQDVHSDDQQSIFIKLCLYQALCIESSACLSSLVAGVSNLSKDKMSAIKNAVIFLLELTQKVTYAKLEFSIPGYSNEFVFSMLITNRDIEYLQTYVGWFPTSGEKRYQRHSGSLRSICLFLLMFVFNAEISNTQSKTLKSFALFEQLNGKLDEQSAWKLFNYSEVIENDIENLSSSNPVDIEAAQAWRSIFELIRGFQRIKISHRRHAEIFYSQNNYEGDGDGMAKFAFPHKQRPITFYSSQVFISGHIQTESNSSRPAKVDVYKTDGDTRVTAVLGPTKLFTRLPFPHRLISPIQISKWIGRHKALFLMLGTATIFALGGLINFWIDVNTWLGATVFGLGSIALNLYSGAIQTYLETRYPEDIDR